MQISIIFNLEAASMKKKHRSWHKEQEPQSMADSKRQFMNVSSEKNIKKMWWHFDQNENQWKEQLIYKWNPINWRRWIRIMSLKRQNEFQARENPILWFVVGFMRFLTWEAKVGWMHSMMASIKEKLSFISINVTGWCKWKFCSAPRK